MNLNKTKFKIKNSKFLSCLNKDIYRVISDLDKYSLDLPIYTVEKLPELKPLELVDQSVLIYIGKKNKNLYFLDIMLMDLDLTIDIFLSVCKLVIIKDKFQDDSFIFSNMKYTRDKHLNIKKKYYI